MTQCVLGGTLLWWLLLIYIISYSNSMLELWSHGKGSVAMLSYSKLQIGEIHVLTSASFHSPNPHLTICFISIADSCKQIWRQRADLILTKVLFCNSLQGQSFLYISFSLRWSHCPTGLSLRYPFLARSMLTLWHCQRSSFFGSPSRSRLQAFLLTLAW